KLQAYHVSLDEVEAVASDALDFGLLKYTNAAKTRVGGIVDTPNQRLLLQHVLPVIVPADLAKVPVNNRTKPDGSPLTLGDLSRVVWEHQPLIGDAVIDSKRGLLLVVEKYPWANTLEVTHGIDAAFEQMKPGLPGIKITPTIFRSAYFIDQSISDLSRALLIAVLLVMLVLGCFLFEWRPALISLVPIPLSLLAAGLVISLRGSTINTLIMAGFVIAVGGVVDDAIIDVENIVRRLRQHRREGSNRSTASVIIEASLEVRSAIIHAVLIDVAVLFPPFLLSGGFGSFFPPLAAPHSFGLRASLVIAAVLPP